MAKRDERALLPPVNAILEKLGKLPVNHEIATHIVRDELKACRKSAELRRLSRPEIIEAVVRKVATRIEKLAMPSLRRVINGTGIILHTGLGRAILSDGAVAGLTKDAAAYCNLEIDLESAERGDRNSIVEEMLRLLTGAEAGVVVNNNAAAVMIVLSALSRGKEVIVSRGELIEIGGSFRLPEIMEQSGAVLREVGTTNKTRLTDYTAAIGKNTGLILKAHTSNYRIKGFTESVGLAELSTLARRKKVPLVHDLGGGALVDLVPLGLPPEPVVSDSIKSGADIVTFSGDKILGGPQAGLIIGRKKYLSTVRKHALMRVVRCGRLTYAALEPTLRIFVQNTNPTDHHPILRMLTISEKECMEKAKYLADRLTTDPRVGAHVVRVQSESGSGTMPLEGLPGAAVKITIDGISSSKLAGRLRMETPPVLGYVRKNAFHVDTRTLLPGDVDSICKSIGNLVAEL